MSGVLRLLRQWWREGVDYDWMSQAIASHSLLGAAKFAVGSGGVLTLIVNSAALSAPSGPQYHVSPVVVWLLSATALAWLVRWWVFPWPTAGESLALFAACDVIVTAVCMLNPSPVGRTFGLVLLAITGMHLCVFHTPKVVAAHTIWSLATVAAVSAPLVRAGDTAAAAVVVATMAAAIAVPPALQFGYWLFRRDMLSDPLTALLSRRGLEYQASVTFERAEPDPICVMVIDLDRFKSVNDTLGHPAGDQVLIHTAERLRATAPRDSIVARIGGEEFAVVARLPPASAVETADRLRRAIAEPIAEPMAAVSITASIGMAAAVSGPPATLDDLIHRADRAMYRAKQRGGDSVVVANDFSIQSS
ncbi:GGDEF domain-containing protein [Nocardia sp. CDC159]|uniref:GGDEF domain-containing protein n=1 Tax=Nocardia pulmonis TaxID=2951408 RepID=A0A9X2E5P8_9NOCA|nr:MULTISPECIES: GGDEF domain-containing protein [Nocardia]MCM6774602.1 GGDEF domain-containing protein [Nocardia pulmonis]MCM6787333.1 GGDEF domain-containing protein [Nocardia sp. CDC159]